MPEISLNPGHTHNLRELGILKEDEEGLESDELIRRAVEKDKVLPVIHNLQQEAGNYTFFYLDDILDDTEDLIRINNPKELERLQENVARFGRAINSAMVRMPILEKCGTEMFKQAKLKGSMKASDLEGAEGYLEQIKEFKKKADKMMDEKGIIYIKKFEEFKKELLSRGGAIGDIFDI